MGPENLWPETVTSRERFYNAGRFESDQPTGDPPCDPVSCLNSEILVYVDSEYPKDSDGVGGWVEIRLLGEGMPSVFFWVNENCLCSSPSLMPPIQRRAFKKKKEYASCKNFALILSPSKQSGGYFISAPYVTLGSGTHAPNKAHFPHLPPS